ncbi:MAG TPA: hypothetical protein VMV49_09570 [Candidatus Deferrimicrobium sp.]|nr:hypothetical protein [Candidatus Deferrimicrobium sp.]
MKVEDVEFWKYVVLENADFLLRKRKTQGAGAAISIKELVQETIKQVRGTLGKEITAEAEEVVAQIVCEKCIGDNLWKIKEGYVIPTYFLADIFLGKANELFSAEERRMKSVLGVDELIDGVADQLKATFGEKIDAKPRADLHTFLDKLCRVEQYFKKIQNKYIIFDTKGRDRLKQISADPEGSKAT